MSANKNNLDMRAESKHVAAVLFPLLGQHWLRLTRVLQIKVQQIKINQSINV